MPVPVKHVAPSPGPSAPIEDAGSLSAMWISPRGVELPLTDIREQVGLFTTPMISGWGAVPVELTTDPHPRGGTTVRHIRDEPRDTHWALHIYGDTHMEFVRNWWKALRALTDTKRYGPGTLRVSRPDGTSRQVVAYYSEGLGGAPGDGWLSANPVVTFHCPDGYWRDAKAKQLAWQHQDPLDFYDPFMSVSSSQVLGEAVVDNRGDTDAWPEWTLTGPASSLDATNLTTGKSFVLTYTLTAGQQITITTQRPKVRGPAGETLTSALNWPGAVLWGLAPGINDIDMQVAGAGTGTRIDLSYTQRYESC